MSSSRAAFDDLEIRRARRDDLGAIVRVWRRARWDAQPWLEGRLNHSSHDDLLHFRDVVMCENDVWVAHADCKVVGLLALRNHKIDQLHVEPHSQGRGIGTALLDHAKQLSPEGLSLFTHQRNERARIFYERRGFRIVRFGTSPSPENEPDVEYAWAPTGS